MALAKNIRYLRKKYGYSQDFIAEKLGYKSYTTIQKWEMGTSEPPLSKLKELAKIFNVNMNDLANADLERPENNTTVLTSKDERDIKNDLDNLMDKLKEGERGPAAYDGEEIPADDQELFAGQLELMLRKLKVINKEKYNPNKNKDKK
ncbi:MAG: helix-turn-helix transcriptional regulator [Anaerostipes sp.]|nr:helix-turn-helix transcriptional regulator [Anaerostipes sp.]